MTRDECELGVGTLKDRENSDIKDLDPRATRVADGPSWKVVAGGVVVVVAMIEVVVFMTHGGHIHFFDFLHSSEHTSGHASGDTWDHAWAHGWEFVLEAALFSAVVLPMMWFWIVRPTVQARRAARQKELEIRLRLEEGGRIGRLGYWSYSTETSRFTWSPECYRILEVNPDTCEDPDDSYIDLIHPDDRSRLENAFDRVLREGGEYEMLHRVVLSDDRVKWMREKAEAVLSPTGTVIGVRGIIQDQTETMALEDTLRENEERFQATFEQAAMGMAHVAPSGELLRVNKKFCAMLGYNEAELQAKSFQDITHPDDIDTDRGNMRAAMVGSVSEYRRKKRYLHKDGSVVWAGITVSIVRGADSAPRYFILVAEELDDRIRAERALAERTAQLESVLANVDQGIGMVDAEGRIVALNRSYYRILDLEPGSFKDGSRLWDLLRYLADRGEFGQGDVDVDALTKAAFDRSLSETPTRFHRTRPNGTELEIKVNPTGQGGWVTTFTDVTERIRMERDLSDALRLAEEANRAKSDFLATMSHELRTPLNAILGFAEILSHQYFGPMGQSRYVEYAEDIETSGRYLLELINDVLDISKIEAGEYMLSPGSVDARAVIDDCVTLMSHRAQSEDIRVVQSVEPDLPDIVADRRALKQMLLNLLSNALKFTQEGGEVEVSARMKGGKHEITVRDTGPGIAPEEIPFLLEPFKKGRENPEVSVEGAGLGLAITNSLARLHSGTVVIDSKLGRGTAVTIRLPMREPYRDEGPAPRLAVAAR